MSDPRVRDFAPLLRFDRNERHFPAEPDDFRRNAHFRQATEQRSNWNRRLKQWEAPRGADEDHVGADWPAILGQIQQLTAAARPGGVTSAGPVTRPLDPRNLWGGGRPRGFYLELKDGFGHDRSGSPPDAGSPARIFHDTFTCVDTAGREWEAIAYWFFYIYNWHVISKHEGDWEHITLYFLKAEPERPKLIYYAAHNEGYLVSAGSAIWLPDAAVASTPPGPPSPEATHPIVYVSRFGHPSYPTVDDPGRYTLALRTWDREIPGLDPVWSAFDGAWGEIGMLVHSSGPLGPWFKRGRDTARFRLA